MSGRGGEDTVLDAEFELMRNHGHNVYQWKENTGGLKNASPLRKLLALMGFIWSTGSYSKAKKIINEIHPDVIHVHNFFPLLSPSILWAAKVAGVPVVMTLHNYRLICPNAMLLRDGKPCELCVGHLPFAAIKHNCKYAESFTITIFIIASQLFHRALKTFNRKVDSIIVLSDFAKSVFARTYLPVTNLFVKPNFISDICVPDMSGNRKHKVVFVGRIQSHKGVDLLINAWMQMDPGDYKLIIIGDGPDRSKLEELSKNCENIEWLGFIPHDEVRSLLNESQFLVLPSRWYEGFPMVILEAFASKIPVVIPNHGPFLNIVEDNVTGYFFNSGDNDSLKSKLEQVVRLSHEEWLVMSESAYNQYLNHYTSEINYKQLMAIYESAISRSNNAGSGSV